MVEKIKNGTDAENLAYAYAELRAVVCADVRAVAYAVGRADHRAENCAEKSANTILR